MSRVSTKPPPAAAAAGSGVTFTDGTTIDFVPNTALTTTVTAEVTSVVARRDSVNTFAAPAAGQQIITPTGGVSASTSVGGGALLDNSGSTGAGLVLYTTRGADAGGRLLNVRVNNVLNPQSAINVDYLGAGNAVTINHNVTSDSTSEAFDINSLNLLDTVFGIRGRNDVRGTVKFSHNKKATDQGGGVDNSDNAAAVVRLNWEVDEEAATTAITGRSGNTLQTAGHSFTVGQMITFAGTGSIGGVVKGESYWIASATATDFTLSDSPGGATKTLTSFAATIAAQLRHATAIQGIYVYSEDASVTTGDLVTIYNGQSNRSGTERLRLTAAGQLSLPIATGTAPLAVTSTTLNTNLNADLVDGQHGAFYLDRANHTGTQLAATISNFSAAADARIAAAVGVTVQAWDADLDTWATKTAPAGTVVGTTDAQVLTNKTLTTPTIGSFVNATHDHSNAAGGGQLTGSAFSSTTGSGAVVLASSPTIVTPTIASFANATHTHLNAAGGGTLTPAAIGADADLATFSLPASTTISAFGATLVDDANAAASIATLGLDADLATFALPASTTISAFGATLVDDANAAASIATLGLDADLATFALPASTTISTFGASLIDDAAASNARTTLGLGTIATEAEANYALLAGRSGGQTLKGGTGASENLTLMSTNNATLGVVTTADQVTLTQQGSGGGLVIGLDTALFQVATDVLAVGVGDTFMGRTIAGSGAASGTLTLKSTTNATKGKVVAEERVQIHTTNATTTAAYNAMDMMAGATITLNGASAAFRGFFLPSNATISITADPAAASIQGFGLTPTITTTGNRTVGTTIGAQVAPTITPASGSVTTWNNVTAFVAGGTLTDPGGGGTATVANIIGLSSTMTIAAGWTVSGAYRGVGIAPPTNAGTIANFYGVDIGAPGFTATTDNVSVRSLSTTLQMRHGGPALVGTTGAPNTSSGLDVAGDLSTRMTGLTLANGANDNIAIGNSSFVRITGPTGAFSVQAIGTPFSGKRLTLYNTTTFAMTLKHEDGTSATPAQRIRTMDGTDVVTVGEGNVSLIYDGTAARWIVVGREL